MMKTMNYFTQCYADSLVKPYRTKDKNEVVIPVNYNIIKYILDNVIWLWVSNPYYSKLKINAYLLKSKLDMLMKSKLSELELIDDCWLDDINYWYEFMKNKTVLVNFTEAEAIAIGYYGSLIKERVAAGASMFGIPNLDVNQLDEFATQGEIRIANEYAIYRFFMGLFESTVEDGINTIDGKMMLSLIKKENQIRWPADPMKDNYYVECELDENEIDRYDAMLTEKQLGMLQIIEGEEWYRRLGEREEDIIYYDVSTVEAEDLENPCLRDVVYKLVRINEVLRSTGRNMARKKINVGKMEHFDIQKISVKDFYDSNVIDIKYECHEEAYANHDNYIRTGGIYLPFGQVQFSTLDGKYYCFESDLYNMLNTNMAA